MKSLKFKNLNSSGDINGSIPIRCRFGNVKPFATPTIFLGVCS